MKLLISLIMSNLIVGTVFWAIDLNLNLLNWAWISYVLATYALFCVFDLAFFAKDFRDTTKKMVSK